MSTWNTLLKDIELDNVAWYNIDITIKRYITNNMITKYNYSMSLIADNLVGTQVLQCPDWVNILPDLMYSFKVPKR